MNKRGFVAVCAPRLGGRVAAEAAVEAIFDAIVRELVAGWHVVLTGFGTFEAVERKLFRPAEMFRRFMVEPGLLPGDRSVHEQAQDRLRRDWPVLADALDELCAAVADDA